MRRLRILLIEDHVLMAEAVRFALAESPEFELAAVAENVDEGIALAERLMPELVLVDLRLPGGNGFDVLRRLAPWRPQLTLIVFSACEEPAVIELALRAGACAFITKRIDPADFPAALRQVLDSTIFRPVPPTAAGGAQRSSIEPLTERERAVLDGVAAGLSNREIAEQLVYAEQTVKLDLTRIFGKLGVSSRTQALGAAYRLGLLDGGELELELALAPR